MKDLKDLTEAEKEAAVLLRLSCCHAQDGGPVKYVPMKDLKDLTEAEKEDFDDRVTKLKTEVP